MRRTRRALVVATVTISSLLLGACAPLFGISGSTTSAPTGEQVEPDIQPFYSQVLEWSDCGSGLQCATASAPLDWDDPARESIELALVRQVATSGAAIGSLLVNPGGPGASGVSIITESIDFAVTAKLQESFDVVGFDPRGVGQSSAVSCHTDEQTLDDFLYDIVPGALGSDEWLDALEETNEQFGQDCLRITGELLGTIDTVSAARDLDMLRAILGDKKLNYLGYSYGTYLGATYADLYPQNTGRLVLDGAIDPAATSFEVTATQAEGFENAMLAFLQDCADRADCPFENSPAAAQRDIRTLLDRLDASPIRNADGRQLGSNTMTAAIILPLYDADNWQYLRELFTLVLRGDAEFAFVLADSYNSRDVDGQYLDNSLESRIAINCLDYPREPDREVWRAEAAQLAKIAPIFGPQFSYGETSCAGWPFVAERERGPIAAVGSADILVVGTTNDPATPYVWAEALAQQLENGHLVTRDGEGHTGYNKGNTCVNTVVDEFFISGTVPATDPLC